MIANMSSKIPSDFLFKRRRDFLYVSEFDAVKAR